MELLDNPQDMAGEDQFACVFFGLFLLLFSGYGVIPLGPLYSETQIQKPKPKQGNAKSDKTVSSKTHDLLGEQKVENIEEINKLKKEMVKKDVLHFKLLQEKDVFYSKLIQEKENEIKRLRKEKQEYR
ncbi:hypothetical protein MOSE0_F00188 [Monosporozyma servazzii]